MIKWKFLHFVVLFRHSCLSSCQNWCFGAKSHSFQANFAWFPAKVMIWHSFQANFPAKILFSRQKSKMAGKSWAVIGSKQSCDNNKQFEGDIIFNLHLNWKEGDITFISLKLNGRNTRQCFCHRIIGWYPTIGLVPPWEILDLPLHGYTWISCLYA